MILKMMEDSDLMDDLPTKGCHVIDEVQEVKFRHMENGEAALDVQYRRPNRGLDIETFVLRGNAYLMNDAGKTLTSFSSNPMSTPVSKR